jgi:hypothetical protein
MVYLCGDESLGGAMVARWRRWLARPTAWGKVMKSWLSGCWSFLRGWWSVLRPGFNATVIVLVAAGIFSWRYAGHLHPDTGTPQPGFSEFSLSFAHAHNAHSPIKVNVTLTQGQPPGAPADSVQLDLEVSGPGLTHPGLSLQGQVPSGATGDTSEGSEPRITRAGSHDNVYFTPTEQRRSFWVELSWFNTDSAPMQLRGANLAVEFPDISVNNMRPSVRMSRQLELEGDYAYIAGHPPDHQKPDLPMSKWAWNPVTSPPNQGFESMTVEARSAAVDDQDHADEFKSGIFYGVAVAAFIAALQEFCNAVRKGEDELAG